MTFPETSMSASLRNFCIAAPLLVPLSATAAPTLLNSGDTPTSYTLGRTQPKPRFPPETSGLVLVEGIREKEGWQSVAFNRTAEGARKEITGSIKFSTHAGQYGGGVLLLDTARYGVEGAAPKLFSWAEPSLAGCIGVGFDTWNPPTSDWYSENGNFYDRPQREVVLYWDGAEIRRVAAPIDFAKEGGVTASFRVRFVAGGAFFSLDIDGEDAFTNHFIPHCSAYESRLAVGATGGPYTTAWTLESTDVKWGDDLAAELPKALIVPAIAKEVFNGKRQNATILANLPDAPPECERILGVFKLEAPPGGFDRWDRGGAIRVHGDAGEQFELLRFMTPFGRGGTWYVDLTDYAPLLRGKRTFDINVDTWTDPQGWAVSLDLEYYPGKPARTPILIKNLWNGMPEYGNPDSPLEDFFPERYVTVPEGATSARVRVTVTGHGQAPATGNAAEFLPSDRTLAINGEGYQNRLWVTDCYLNTLRPQGGTWKFDRAGWCPGSVVTPWDVEVMKAAVDSGELIINYVPMPYTNLARDKAKANHWVESTVFFYGRKPTPEERRKQED